MPKTQLPNCARIQLLHEVLLCLNLALVSFYALTMYNFVGAGFSMGTSDAYAFLYWFLRGAVRINNVLRYHPSGIKGFARWPDAGGRLGVELAFAFSTVFISVAFLSVLQFARGSRFYRAVLHPVGGLVPPLAFPAVYILLFDRPWTNLAMSSTWSVAIPELICACILFLFYVLRPFSNWVMGVLMSLHFGFWALVLLRRGGVDTIYGNIPPPILLVIVPLGGAFWLLYVRILRRRVPMQSQGRPRSKWVLTSLAVSVAGLGVLWLPGRGYSLVHANNPDSLTIEMWRSNCQVSCPVYTVTVHGNGAVDYVGEHFVMVRGIESAFVSGDQIHAILEAFDRADFFRLEDKAFAWGYHTSRVGVKITLDGKTKEVWSDTYHIGAKSGFQAKFVEAAAAVDRIIGTDRWVKCGGSRCQQ